MSGPILPVIDILQDFFAKIETSEKVRLIESTNALADIVPKAGGRAIWIRQEYRW